MLDPQVMREGSDITLVGWGAQLSVMEQACLEAEKVYVSLSLVMFYLLNGRTYNQARICVKFGMIF